MYLFIDTETGGLDPSRHSLLSLCCVVAPTFEPSAADHLLYYETMPDDMTYAVQPSALAVNRISLADRNPVAYSLVKQELLTYLRNAWEQNGRKPLILTGWNVSFDYEFVIQQLGISRAEWGRYVSHRKLDLVPIAMFMELPLTSYALTSCAKYFGIETAGAHDARKDVELTRAVGLKLMEERYAHKRV